MKKSVVNKKIDPPKISIVMAYYNRKEQLIQTLKSILASSYKNIEIIIVDDNSRLDQRVSSFIDDISGHLDIRVITISEEQKTWTNPCMAFNIGLRKASGDIIMLQSPEVLHVGDCIQHAVENLRLGDWLSYNCYGSPSFDYNKRLHQKTDSELFEIVDSSASRVGGCSVERDDVGGWLNHYDNHFVAYHYCAAIYKKDLFDVMNGGFDEDFKNSIGTDDDEFMKRLTYNKFNFKINEFKKSEPFVIHQFHEKPSQIRNVDHRTTRHVFDNACRKMGFAPQNDIALAPKNEIPMSRRVLIKENK